MQHSVILIKPCPYTPSLDGIYSKWPQSSSLMKWDHGYQREWTCTHTFSSVGFFFGSVLLQCVVSEATVLISQVKSADCVNFFVWSCTVEQLEDSSVRIFLGNSLPLVPVLLHLFFFWALHTLFTASSHLGQCKASATKSAILDRASLLLHMWVWNCKSALTKLSHLQSCKSATSVPTSSFHHHLCKAKQSHFIHYLSTKLIKISTLLCQLRQAVLVVMGLPQMPAGVKCQPCVGQAKLKMNPVF